MAHNPPTAFILRLAGLGLLGASLAWGCAAGQSEPSGSDDGSTSASDGGGAAGGQGGAGGVAGTGGGTGGAGLCDMDCSQITAPDCNVAVCNDGSYPGTVGACVVVSDEDGTSCEDGEFCTVNDSCLNGACAAGPANDCAMQPAECQEVVCNEDSDSCSFEATANGTACTSDDLCVSNATCSAGVCSGGDMVDCFFAPVPNECHVAVCNPQNGMCEPIPGNDGQGCTDQMDLCTENKICSGGVCGGGAPKDCSGLTQGCNTGVCDTVTGTCTAMPVGEGQICDDVDACTMGETCTMGTCGNGAPVTNCSMTADGCCPANCSAANDFDCNCPGTFVNGTCIYVPNTAAEHSSVGAAQAQCQALGTGWDLCSPTELCDPATYTYLDAAGCSCTGGSAACNCTGINLYFHVTGGQSPFYVRQPNINGCSASAQCTNSTSASCGTALCCK
jgi:hypothetical protein